MMCWKAGKTAMKGLKKLPPAIDRFFSLALAESSRKTGKHTNPRHQRAPRKDHGCASTYQTPSNRPPGC